MAKCFVFLAFALSLIHGFSLVFLKFASLTLFGYLPCLIELEISISQKGFYFYFIFLFFPIWFNFKTPRGVEMNTVNKI